MSGEIVHICDKEKEIATLIEKVDKIEEALKETSKEMKENHSHIINKFDETMDKIDRDYVKKIEFNQYKSRADEFMDKRQIGFGNWCYNNTGTVITILTLLIAGIGKINGWF